MENGVGYVHGFTIRINALHALHEDVPFAGAVAVVGEGGDGTDCGDRGNR